MIIDAISDLHGMFPKLQGGDLLIIGGDLTGRDEKIQYAEFSEWFLAQNYKKKVVIGGNHDVKIENGDYYFNHDWMGYLEDSGTEFEGIKIWGSPWTKRFKGQNPLCMAFSLDTEWDMKLRYDLIPDDIDILISHGPPRGVLDLSYNDHRTGSKELLLACERVKPKLVIFGHIHEGHGTSFGKERPNPIVYCNVSHVEENYIPVHGATRIIFEEGIVKDVILSSSC